MRTFAKSLLLLVAACALTLGISLPAQAQSVTVCLQAHVSVAGTTLVDLPQTCNTVEPPAAP